jgi:hypothetical protein
LHAIYALFDLTIFTLLILGFGTIVGIGLGFLHIKNRVIRADHDKKLISVPGDWTMLVLIFVIFVFEFFIHYSIEANLVISHKPFFEPMAIFILGIISGMTIARNFSYFLKYKHPPNEKLTETK